MASRLALIAIFGHALGMSEAVGIKRRLADANFGKDPEQLEAKTKGSRLDEASPKGGVKQRLAAATSADPSSSSSSMPLTRDLKLDWAKGKLSSAQVQKYAHSATQQGALEMGDVASAGNFGKQPGNVFRALKQLWGIPQGAPDLKWIDIPTKAGESKPHPFILPHELFSALFAGKPDAFTKMITSTPGSCTAYWKQIRSSDFVTQHPALPKAEWGKIVPLGLHGDGGKFSHQDSLMTLSWNSLLGEGQTRQKRFLFTVIRKSEMTSATMDRILTIFAWSCNTLLSGRFPKRDWADRSNGRGAPVGLLAEGWKAALAEVRGDWQFYCDVFKFPAWNGAERMCWCCQASSTNRELTWTDSRPTAGWRATKFSHESYLAHLTRIRQAIPPLLQFARGFRHECIKIDVLHCVDLGITLHILGSIFILLAIERNIFGGANYADRVGKLQADLRRWYKGQTTISKVAGTITLESLRTSAGWAKMRAKGAAARHLVPYALQLMEAHRDESSEHKMALQIVRLLARFYDVLKSQGRFLSAACCEEMPRIGQELAILYGALSSLMVAVGTKRWKIAKHAPFRSFVRMGRPHLWEPVGVLGIHRRGPGGEDDRGGHIVPSMHAGRDRSP